MRQSVYFFSVFNLGAALLGACLPVIGQKGQSFFIVEWIFVYVNEVEVASGNKMKMIF